MNEFTASNGVGIRIADDNVLEAYSTNYWRGVATQNVVEALREFFRAEEDERLGRWRDPSRTEHVVYKLYADTISVVSEQHGTCATYRRGESTDTDSYLDGSARAYFDAHPEPKPWYEAQPGDVWLLTFAGFEMDEASPWTVRPGAMSTDPSEFVYPQNGNTLALNDPDIVDARRLWPEVA